MSVSALLVAVVVISVLVLLFNPSSKPGRSRLPKKTLEEKYGSLHCDGLCCSINDKCSDPERLFCRDVLKKLLPNTKISAQHVVFLPSGISKIDFAFITSDSKKIAIELDGYGPHVSNLTREAFDAQLKRQNELVLAGWQVLRFSFDQLTKATPYCIECLKQVLIGSDTEKVSACRSTFKDVFYPYTEGKVAKDILRASGALYSQRRNRWYFLADFVPINMIRSHWDLTTWTECPHCRSRSVGKTGQYGPYWQCDSCRKTFNT